MNYNSKYVVRLTLEEQEELEQCVRRGKLAAAKRMRAHVLRKAYVEQGLAAAIERKPAVRPRCDLGHAK